MSHKRTWTLKKVKSGIDSFYSKHNRYPVSRDFDLDPDLPSARHVQRIFGGLVSLRKKLKIVSEKDFSKGSYSSTRAQKIKEQSTKTSRALLSILQKYAPYALIEVKVPIKTYRSTFDFKLGNEAQNCVVEHVNPRDDRTLIECIENKLRKIANIEPNPKKVFIVIMNTKINQGKIEQMKKRRTKPFNEKAIEIHSLESFIQRLEKARSVQKLCI